MYTLSSIWQWGFASCSISRGTSTVTVASLGLQIANSVYLKPKLSYRNDYRN